MLYRFLLVIFLVSLSIAFKIHYNRNRFNPLKSIQEKETSRELKLKKTNLLLSIWQKIAFPNEHEPENDFRLKDFGLTRYDVKGLLQNFQNCKDCAADNAFLMAIQDESNEDVLRLSNVAFPLISDDDPDIDEDPNMWSPHTNPEEEVYSDDSDEEMLPIFPVEASDEIVLTDTKKWVQAVIADFGVCPFTSDSKRAGIPMGEIRYIISRATGADEAFYAFWHEVDHMLRTDERSCSTVLLVFPELELFGNYELFEAYCESLSDALCSSTMCFEDELQLVFFHPKYQFRDGQARTGEEMGAANFARRGPWPIINILRTPQVRAAQRGIPTGQVYAQNEQRLSEVGASVLQRMLYERDWAGIPVHAYKAKALLEKLRQHEEAQSSLAAAVPAEVAEEPAVPVCPFPQAAKNAPPAASDLEEVMAGLQRSKEEGRAASTEEDFKKLADEVQRWLEENPM